MTETITQDDLAALARKLDEFGDVLTDKEQALLLAVFTLAGKEIDDRVRAGSSSSRSQTESGRALPVQPRSAVLSEGFTSAFVAVSDADFRLRTGVGQAGDGVGAMLVVT